jgi:FixJ family two-component response regulator
VPNAAKLRAPTGRARTRLTLPGYGGYGTLPPCNIWKVPAVTKQLITVVDDDPGMLEAIERLLVAHGFDVEVFTSGGALQARRRLEDARCLILDVNIPGGPGIELRRRLANAGVSIPVIYITANDSESVRKDVLNSGCVAYLLKPFKAASLIEAIEQTQDAQ